MLVSQPRVGSAPRDRPLAREGPSREIADDRLRGRETPDLRLRLRFGV